MTTADDILDQIDTALRDNSVSDDAMRSRPPARTGFATGGTTTVSMWHDGGWQPVEGISVELHCEEPEQPPGLVPAVHFSQGRWVARDILVRRLVNQHGLTEADACRAVVHAELGHDNPHADLVRAEARATIQEIAGPIAHLIRQTIEAMQPAMERAGQAMRQLAEAVNTTCPEHTPARRLPDRPAWQSPYGPPARRR